MAVQSYDLRYFDNGAWNPGLMWAWNSDQSRWERKFWQGDIAPSVESPNSVTLEYPLEGQVVSGSVFTPSATVFNAKEVKFLLDGTVDLGEVDQVGNLYSIPQLLTLDIANGAHTISVQVKYLNNATQTITANVVFSHVNVSDPVTNGATTELIALINPDSSKTEPAVSGTAFVPVVYVHPSLGTVTSVQFSIGSPIDKGYLSAVGAPSYGANYYQMDSDFNTVSYQASLVDAGVKANTEDAGSPAIREATKCDVWTDFRAKVTFSDGTIKFSPYVRAVSENVPFVGATGKWNPNKLWAANTSGTMTDFYNSYKKVQSQGSYQKDGGIYGKELQASQLVVDPDATNSYGHVAFPNKVIYANVPNNYGAQTAGMANSYEAGKTYSSTGDQTVGGGVRWQASTPCLFFEGDIAYYGYAFRIHPQFPTPSSTHISIGQIYGNANGTDPDWGLGFMLDAHRKLSEHKDAELNQWQYWGNRFNPRERSRLFSMPFYRGKWVSLVIGMQFSTDPRKGWIELYTAQPGVNSGKLTQHTFPNGAGRLRAVTLPKLSSGAPFHSHIYRAINSWTETDMTQAWFYGMRTGPDAVSVNPNTYGSGIIYANS